MKRIIWMFLMSLVHIPYICFHLFRMAAHPENYPIEERYKIVHRIAECGVRGGRVELITTGVEKLPKEGGYILYPNHQGLFDVMALVWIHEKPISAVMKQELMKIPFLKQIILCMGGIPLNREDARQGLMVIKQVAEEVKEGGKFIIFAEGTRSREGNKLQEFKGGSFKSATKAKCPVVPVALIDSYKVMDSGSLKKFTVQLHVLDPIPYEEYKDMKTVEIAAMVRGRIEAKIAECEKE